MLNNWTFFGNIGQDAEVKQIDNGKLLVFSVAIDRSYYDKGKNERVEKTDWVNVAKRFSSDANVKIANYLKKGEKVAVQGVPYLRTWKDQNGEAKGSLQVQAMEIKPLTWPDNNQNQNNGNNSSVSGDDDDDLPF